MQLKLLIKASDVPKGECVTKRGGEKRYTIRGEVNIYQMPPTPKQVIKAEEGTVFLVSADGEINVISGDTEVLWVTTLDNLNRLKLPY